MHAFNGDRKGEQAAFAGQDSEHAGTAYQADTQQNDSQMLSAPQVKQEIGDDVVIDWKQSRTEAWAQAPPSIHQSPLPASTTTEEKEKRSLSPDSVQSAVEKKLRLEFEDLSDDEGETPTPASSVAGTPVATSLSSDETELVHGLERLLQVYDPDRDASQDEQALYDKLYNWMERRMTMDARFIPWKPDTTEEQALYSPSILHSSRAGRFHYFKSRRQSVKKYAEPATALLIGNLAWKWRKPDAAGLQEQTEPNIIISGTEGNVTMIREGTSAEDFVYETKGDTITTMAVHKIFAHSPLDLITGDADGNIKLISQQRVLVKHTLGAAVTCIEVVNSMANSTYIVAGDSSGVVTAFDFIERLWQVRVGGLQTAPDHNSMDYNPGITAILSLKLYDPYGMRNSILLVCDGAPHIHVFQGDQRILTMGLPSSVTSMFKGYFSYRSSPIDTLIPKAALTSPRSHPQVLMATDQGEILIMDGWLNIRRYIALDTCVRKLKGFRLESQTKDDTDYIAVVGHFCDMNVFKDGKHIYSLPTHDWIHDFDIISLPDDPDGVRVGVTLLDGHVQTYRMLKSEGKAAGDNSDMDVDDEEEEGEILE
ncbi:uncharacterized protein SPPG_06533 [Spizellomyces punctatus DAOM BR117]|uniref:Uncharacterized protein n=1 Tax=Spizellomyces punctatus (strain DAOM BR117) TaxID=645134 RepID=A0A0L0H9C1_SPIPD|nr:uncharacterized protein SPPG_06533 [Spizellomyces punctatus DAOM BR117]KNC98125.1 hypothetical protein SPPG_06533 [Spizellomyces punctatus DAOM BR117]|eukprot:XP_016606165.1 hypothetical protein SPPG_06533 [Spizellomyces punctatus DAOM BR117]